MSSGIRKYLIYATGELLLVALGILIALQVNNWNSKRIANNAFRDSLELVYNAVKTDLDWLQHSGITIGQQIDTINRLLHDPLLRVDYKLVHKLFWLDSDPTFFDSDTEFLFTGLKEDISSMVQKELVKEISNYVNNLKFFIRESERSQSTVLTKTLLDLGIPNTFPSFGYSPLTDFTDFNPSQMGADDLDNLKKFVGSKPFRSALFSLLNNKSKLVGLIIDNLSQDGRSIMEKIRNYDPKVLLLYDDIGIVGNATAGGWAQSTPMFISDPDLALWEIRTELQDGFIKFRNRNSWNQNWGGDPTLSGEAMYYGRDIPVQKGSYHIRLDLSANRYEITPAQSDVN